MIRDKGYSKRETERVSDVDAKPRRIIVYAIDIIRSESFFDLFTRSTLSRDCLQSRFPIIRDSDTIQNLNRHVLLHALLRTSNLLLNFRSHHSRNCL